MRVFAYCAANYVDATRRAAGVEPLACPPVTAENIDPKLFEDNDFIYINLHSVPQVGVLTGTVDGPPVALRAQQMDNVHLGGAIVFAEACFLGDEMHPMRQAFLDAGASAVIAGPGKNYGGKTMALKGADVLGFWIRRGLEAGIGLNLAFWLARAAVRHKAHKSASAKDALGFRIFRR